VLKHLKIAKKKGSILFKKIEDYKNNKLLSSKDPDDKEVDKKYLINR
jgi:hypothetical protein